MGKSILPNRQAVVIILTALAAIVVCAGFYLVSYPSAQPPAEVKGKNFEPIDIKFNPELFYPAIAEFPPLAGQASPIGRALIVPHHDLASRLIAQAMAKLSSREIKTIYLIGPNHSNAGRGEVITARATWRTSLGSVETDQTLIQSLAEQRLVVIDNPSLSIEHSVGALIPFIKYYFPLAKVVPLILNHETDRGVADKLAVFMEKRDDSSLVIGSLDFSHYLPSLAAEKNDLETERAIKELDYEKIFSLDDGFLDSPITLIAVMKYAELAGAGQPEFIAHSNSAEMTNSPIVLNSTSYFTIIFESGN